MNSILGWFLLLTALCCLPACLKWRGSKEPLEIEQNPDREPEREPERSSAVLALEGESEETVSALMPLLRALEAGEDLRPWAQRLRHALPGLGRDIRRPLLVLLRARPEPAWVELLASWPDKHLLLDADEVGAAFTALIQQDREAMTRPEVARQLEAMLPWLVRRDDAFAQLARVGDPATLQALSPYCRGGLASPAAVRAHREIVRRYELCVAGDLTLVVNASRGALTSSPAPGDMSLAQKNPPEWEG